MAAFISKSRRPKFELNIKIFALDKVPLVSGASFVKWHLPSSTNASHRGRTQNCPIRDHRVQYDYEQQIPVRLVVGKDGMLQECMLVLEVIQEYSGTGRGERITLGNIRLNLAEYAGAAEPDSPSIPSDDPSEGIVRRYLMQDSKINSTLKIGLSMKQIEGTKDWHAPALKIATVLGGGIAGLLSASEPASTTHGVASHAGDTPHDNGIEMPTLTVNSREAGEMTELYKRILNAYWSSLPSELKADEAIEDIFAGGDGWGKNGPPPVIRRTSHLGTSTDSGYDKKEHERGSGRHDFRGPHRRFGRHSHHKRQPPPKAPGELDEFEVRDDLRSWTVGEKDMA